MRTFSMLIMIAFACCFMACQNLEERDFYQIKIYRIDSPEQESGLDSYLKNAFLPALRRAGIERVGVFKPIEGLNEEMNYVMVFIPFRSLDEFENLGDVIKLDDLYKMEGEDYIKASHDDPPYVRIESILLKSFRGMPCFAVPDLTSPPSQRVYELRSYEGATERLYKRKVEMFNDAGEIELFQKLEFNPIFFGEVLSSTHMPHLMYMTAFADTTSQREHWDAFRVDPDWLEMRDLERYANTVSSITRYLMYPTNYSDF